MVGTSCSFRFVTSCVTFLGSFSMAAFYNILIAHRMPIFRTSRISLGLPDQAEMDGARTLPAPSSCTIKVMMDASKNLLERGIAFWVKKSRGHPARWIKFTCMRAWWGVSSISKHDSFQDPFMFLIVYRYKSLSPAEEESCHQCRTTRLCGLLMLCLAVIACDCIEFRRSSSAIKR